MPVERIELPTFGLQNRCSTAELNRRLRDHGPPRKYCAEPLISRRLEYQTCPQRARTLVGVVSGLCCLQTGVKFLFSRIQNADENFMPARDLDYLCDDVNLRGYLAWNDDAKGPRPGVLVFHEGLGLGEFMMERARRLAGLGYVALAGDMFGDRRQATNLQDAMALAGGPLALAPRPRMRVCRVARVYITALCTSPRRLRRRGNLAGLLCSWTDQRTPGRRALRRRRTIEPRPQVSGAGGWRGGDLREVENDSDGGAARRHAKTWPLAAPW